ncbi:tetratricopeptide repeat protein [uncultured Paludibaculum sp.]|uniref:tetratricopeptide repeat protein n=1 Tax=uncultured Paludibaculum sp. TaxID=1765020 RepID=UPI002AAC1B77|nr:tetratricopeptide repeat protein [uncultured Paludibaculum sp.]
MSRLLRFVVKHSLAGQAADLKEYLLGVEVFDRTSAFDPRTDPIVRVEARRLRAKLKAYYEGEGLEDDLIIEIPTGCYAAVFRTRGEARPEAPEDNPATSIAVLPFSNLSPEPDGEYFSDGLTEELIHALTKVRGLRVVAWTTAAQLKEGRDDYAAVGRRLMVGSVLQGSVRRSGERLRITVRLVLTESGQYLWAETYDRWMADLFDIQEDIAREIAESLRVQLLGCPATKDSGRKRWNVDAYDRYLQGRYQWNKRSHEGFQLAIQLFSQAVTIDASFAPGYAGLADSYSVMAELGFAATKDTMPMAKAAALRALELDPDLAEAHTSLGLIESLYEWRWKEAGVRYRRALELHPGYATAQHWYAGDYLATLGRFEEAIERMRLAVQLDPLSIAIQDSMAMVYQMAGRFDEALTEHRRGLEAHGRHYKFVTGMGRVYSHMGRYDEALALFEEARRMPGHLPSLLGAMAQTCGLAGQEQRARALLRELDEMAQTCFVPSTARALSHLGLGEKGIALDWLEGACERRELSVCLVGVHPAYETLHGEPRYEALVKKLGLRG